MARDTGEGASSGGGVWRVITLVVMAVLGAVTLVALIVTLNIVNAQRDRALAAQTHSYDVMILSRTLAGTIAQAEASLGRYVISADATPGQLYSDQWVLAGDEIERLAQLTHDNPEQRPAIAALRAAYDQRGQELSLTARSTQYGKNSQALARYFHAGRARALTDTDRALDRIIATERTLLAERTAAAMHSVHRASRVASVLAVFGVLLVIGAIVLGWLTVRAVDERATARAEAAAEHARAEELEAAVRAATDELQRQEARLRQVQKMEAVGQLTGGIAHDFNNMLAVVLGGLELARRSPGAADALTRRHLDSAREGADRAAALTRRLLAFSREDALNPEPIAAAELIAGMSELLDRTLGDAITLVVRDEAEGCCVRADRVQLENAVLNLAVNARDAMDGRGTLTIATGAVRLAAGALADLPAGDYVTISVADTGSGMTAEVAERAFEPFFTTKPVGKGTGLGLSQIFGYVRQQGGAVAIRTAPGEGTAVTLHLPQVEPATNAAAVEMAPDAGVVSAGPLVVLVVEDDPRVLAATVGALEELGHRAIPCADPFAAPRLLDGAGPVDLIVSDVLMPRQTGPEMVAALPLPFRAIPVLFVTGYAGEATADSLSPHHVLRKPFTLAALERAIADATAESGPERLAAE